MTNIAFKQAHSGNYRRAARGKEDIRYLVIHFTANDGDTAKNNADYFARAEISTSAHYFVDENEVWQSVRDADIAWHCGTRGVYFHPYCRNANSIGIELCSRKNGEKLQRNHPNSALRHIAASARRRNSRSAVSICRFIILPRELKPIRNGNWLKSIKMKG